MTLTTDMITSWRPCPDWPPERVREVCAPLGETFTALQLLRLDTVPPVDLLWVVLRRELLADRTLRMFACRGARRALGRARAAGREPDARSWVVVEVAERFARGEASSDELAAAEAAAWDAAWAAETAAETAAWDAAWAATWAAARDSAWDAARVARAAARAAAWDAEAADFAGRAAMAAERAAQVDDLIELLSEAGGLA